MPSGSVSSVVQGAGATFNRTVSKTVDTAALYGDSVTPITLTHGHTVTAWLKTDADTADCTLPAGHGQTSGVFDVYDVNGDIIRYGVDGTVAADHLDLDGGTGTDFPANATEGIVVCKQQQVNVSIDGDLAAIVAFSSDVDAHVDCQDASSDSIRPFSLAADEPDIWDSDRKDNPYTGDPISKALVSNGTTADGALQILVLQDSTP